MREAHPFVSMSLIAVLSMPDLACTEAGDLVNSAPLSAAPAVTLATARTEMTGRHRTPADKPLTSCGTLTRANTRYVLQNDVSSAGTCFTIEADNITLNLNAHTIRYATEPLAQPRYGILAEACWDISSLAGNPCGGTADHLTVENGTITQGTGAAPFSHAIRIGQIKNSDHLLVHDVTFNIRASSSIPIFTTYAGSDSAIFRNFIHNDVVTIFNRHQIQGASVKFHNGHVLRAGQRIHDNIIVGGAQGGILSSSPGTEIYNNTISQNGRYSNDFAIYEWGNDNQVYNNAITPISGRGIQIGGGAVSVNGLGIGSRNAVAHHNKIVVTELRQNCDYSAGGTACNACEPGGAYGIQFDDNPSKAVAYNNEVTAKADQCPAQALRLTEIGPNNSSHENIYVAQRIGSGDGKAWAIGTGGALNLFLSTNDTFIGDTANFHADWDGMPGGFLCIRCTLAKGANSAPDFVTFSFENGRNPVTGVHFQDTHFGGGADRDSTDMRAIGPIRQYAEYFIDWTFSLTVQDTLGSPVGQAVVTIKDALDKTVFEGTADDRGQISIVLNEFRRFNTEAGVTKEMHTPHTVSVTSATCDEKESTLQVKVDQPTHQALTLHCVVSKKHL